MGVATTLETLIVRLVGDGSKYSAMLDAAVAHTMRATDKMQSAVASMGKTFITKAAQMGRAHKKLAALMVAGTTAYVAGFSRTVRGMSAARKSGKLFSMGLTALSLRLGVVHLGTNMLAGAMIKLGNAIASVGRKLFLFLTVPIFGAAAAITKLSSDVIESDAKYSTVFQGISEEADAMAKHLEDAYLVPEQTGRKLLSTTADLFVGFGFQRDAALDLSNHIQKMAADFAAFDNVIGGVAGASEKLTKGILGNTENLRALGSVVRQDTPEFKKMTKELQATTGMTRLQAQSITILNEVIGQTGDSVGAAAREINQFPSQMRALTGEVKVLATEIGQYLMPTALRFVTAVRKVIRWLRDMNERYGETTVKVLAFVAAIGPIMFIFGKITSLGGGIILLLGKMVTAFGLIGMAVKWILPLIMMFGPAVFGVVAPLMLVLAKFVILGAVIAGLAAAIAGLVIGAMFFPDALAKATLVGTRIIAAFGGWIVGFFLSIFDGRLLKIIVKFFVKMAKGLFSVTDRMRDAFLSIFTGDDYNKDISFFDKILGDFGEGTMELNFGKTLSRIIKEEFPKAKDAANKAGGDLGDESGEGFMAKFLGKMKSGAPAAGLTKEQEKLQEGVDKLTMKLKVQVDTFNEVGKTSEIYALRLQGATDAQLAHATALDKQLTQMKEVKKLTDDVKKMTNALKDQAETFGMTGNAARFYRLQQRGATEEQLAEARALDKHLVRLKEQQKLEEEQQQLVENAKRHSLTGRERMKNKLDELLPLFEKGMIDLDTLSRNVLEGGQHRSTNRLTAIEGGSAEGFAALRGGGRNKQLDQLIKAARMQIVIQKSIDHKTHAPVAPERNVYAPGLE